MDSRFMWCGLQPYLSFFFCVTFRFWGDIDELKSCPTNQLPMYAENAMSVIDSKHKSQFVKLLASRLNEIEKESKRKRIEKVLKKLA